MNTDTIIHQWREKAESNDDENYWFLRSLKLKSITKVDRIARRLHDEVFSIIDCTKCANCCETIGSVFRNADITRIASHVGMSKAAFTKEYLEKRDEDGYKPKELPCPFLGEDNHCKIYEVRPKACAKYPHTDKKSFASRSILHFNNATCCPAVFYIVEEMKKELS